MKLLLFITPHEFRDESLSTVRTFLDKWGISYTITSYSNKDCVGSHGAVCKIGINTGKAAPEDYDGILLIDGNGIDAYKIHDFRPMLDLLLKFNEKNKSIIAIENAVKVPARANIIKGRKIATPPDAETKRLVQLFHGTPTDEALEISGNIMTVRDHRALEEPMQRILAHLGVA